MTSQISDEQLLQDLVQERNKFTERDPARFEGLVEELVRRGVYPAVSVRGESASHMVQWYGASWHQWKGPLECPHCKADLRDRTSGPPFKREIGMVDRAQDRVTHFVCPDCNHTIPR